VDAYYFLRHSTEPRASRKGESGLLREKLLLPNLSTNTTCGKKNTAVTTYPWEGEGGRS